MNLERIAPSVRCFGGAVRDLVAKPRLVSASVLLTIAHALDTLKFLFTHNDSCMAARGQGPDPGFTKIDEHAQFDRAAIIARRIIEQIQQKQPEGPRLYNLNIPTAAVESDRPKMQVVPMGLVRSGERYEKRVDPRGRNYFWATGELYPPSGKHETDLSA